MVYVLLYETPVGYTLFQVNDEKKLSKTEPDDIYDKFFEQGSNLASENGESAKKKKKSKSSAPIELAHFQPFSTTQEALLAATSVISGTVSDGLQTFLQKKLKKMLNEGNGSIKLAVEDKSLATALKDSGILLDQSKCVYDATSAELFRGIRQRFSELFPQATQSSRITADGSASGESSLLRTMQLGLSHALGRYKLKFSSDKVDTMVIQAVGLLDELDKEINIYSMRVKEWYGWHYPELQSILNASGVPNNNLVYTKLVVQAGLRQNFAQSAGELHTVFGHDSDEDHEILIKSIVDGAETSMGVEIAELDIVNIQSLAQRVVSMSEYRLQLAEYLTNRMNAIAPNLTVLLGELVGARLISHAGSLLNLAKQPASTIQILGAEKALFRALKTKHDTPKYGLIYHASLIGQASTKNKGKISRVLAAKSALAIRVDALSADVADEDGGSGSNISTVVGYEGRAKVEARLRQLEGGGTTTNNSNGVLTAAKTAKYDPIAAKTASTNSASAAPYNPASDVVLDDILPSNDDEKKSKKEKKEKKKKEKRGDEDGKKEKKRKHDEDGDEVERKSKKEKKQKKQKAT
jgi:nucleolar protein 58